MRADHLPSKIDNENNNNKIFALSQNIMLQILLERFCWFPFIHNMVTSSFQIYLF